VAPSSTGSGRDVATSGDGFFASFDGPARAARCALAIIDASSSLGVRIRVGVHTGEVEARGDDLGGSAVHIGARIMALANRDEALVLSTAKDLLAGSGMGFEGASSMSQRGSREPGGCSPQGRG
jgi:class 3 adenylate cyclase